MYSTFNPAVRKKPSTRLGGPGRELVESLRICHPAMRTADRDRPPEDELAAYHLSAPCGGTAVSGRPALCLVTVTYRQSMEAGDCWCCGKFSGRIAGKASLRGVGAAGSTHPRLLRTCTVQPRSEEWSAFEGSARRPTLERALGWDPPRGASSRTAKGVRGNSSGAGLGQPGARSSPIR